MKLEEMSEVRLKEEGEFLNVAVVMEGKLYPFKIDQNKPIKFLVDALKELTNETNSVGLAGATGGNSPDAPVSDSQGDGSGGEGGL